MARVNVEEESWARIFRLAQLMSVSVREAAGTMVCLWRYSQDILRSTGTEKEILEWANLDEISETDAQKWIAALKKVKFISCINHEQLEIHGNQIQIDGRLSRIKRAIKGAKSLKKKRSATSMLEAGYKQSTSTLDGCLLGANTIQYNTIQSSADAGVDATTQHQHQNWFANFCFESFADTGMARKAPRVVAAFCSKEVFDQWVDGVMTSRAMKNELNPNKRKRYFDAALENELKSRGV